MKYPYVKPNTDPEATGAWAILWALLLMHTLETSNIPPLDGEMDQWLLFGRGVRCSGK